MPRFYEGDYVTAKNAFQQECRLAIKTPQSLWIDSICYQTMVGECYYRTGDLDEALAVLYGGCPTLPEFSELDAERAIPGVDSAVQRGAWDAVGH